jgi:DNA-3-methyladenine glycosylase
MPSARLPRSFYAHDSLEVARRLLGKRLVHRLADGTRLSGVIVETEAYLGVIDKGAHTFNGRRTQRTEAMYGEPGLSYVYFIYGMYHCLNVVTTAKDVPEAALIRAVDPREGLEHMRARLPHASAHHLANGPGKLCRALEITRAHNALDLTTSHVLWIEDDGAISDGEIVDGPRIGIAYAEDAAHWPLRFGLRGHPALSPPKFPNYLE